MPLEVRYGNKIFPIEVPEQCTLGQLRQLISEATGVLPTLQKLLGKSGLQQKPDGTLLATLGISNTTKLMLVGSTAAEVVRANAPSESEKKKDAERSRLLRTMPLPFWMLPSFGGFLADPYVNNRGHPIEGGSALLALLSMDVILSRVNTLGASSTRTTATSGALLTLLSHEGSAQVSHRFLKSIPTEHRTAIQMAHAVLRKCYLFTVEASKAVTPKEVLAVVDNCLQAIDALSIGEWLMLPSGWIGLKSYTILYLLLRRTAPEVFQLFVVNRSGDGALYHPRWQTAEKIVSCPILRFDRVGRERLTDRTFWLLLHSLWMRQNDPQNKSEFIRSEVFYDVLLPWLIEVDPREDAPRRYASEMFFSEPSAATGTVARPPPPGASENIGYSSFVHAHAASPLCSSSGAIKSAVSAFCFLLEQMGNMSRAELKRVKYVLKYEFFLRAAEDFSRYAQRFLVGGSLTPTASSAPQWGGGLPSEAEKSLRASLERMRAAGVHDSATTCSLTEVLTEGAKRNIVFKNERHIILPVTHYANKTVLVYAGSLDVPGGRRFSELLANATASIQRSTTTYPGTPEVELLFLSCDNSAEQCDEHAGMFTFTRTSFPATALLEQLEVHELPTLLLFDSEGKLVHREGVRCLRADPEASQFPFGRWVGAIPLSATDVRMLTSGAAQLAHHTQKRLASNTLTDTDAQHVVELIRSVEDVVARLPTDDVHAVVREATRIAGSSPEDETSTAVVTTTAGAAPRSLLILQQIIDTSIQEADVKYVNSGLLPHASTGAYFGRPYKSLVPTLEDICDFKPVRSYDELHDILQKSRKAVETLWTRAAHSGTASRVAVQMHIIEFITWLFSTIIPVPTAPPVSVTGASYTTPTEEANVAADFYAKHPFTHTEDVDAQLDMMNTIHYLTISLANAWQAVEAPSRAFDSERCLMAMVMLLVFDAIARHEHGSVKGRMLAVLLTSEGGYYPSTSLGKQTIPFLKVSANLELIRPHLLPLRSAVLRYLQWQQENLRHELFDLRMPDKLELRKGSTTVTFLRTFMDNAGYALDQHGGVLSRNASEMEKLMQWLCSHHSPLAKAHEEFVFYRNMVLLAKFLGTMEMRDTELLHRRKELDSWASWRLSFEEDTPGRQMSAGWRTLPTPPKWECVMVRGRDMDIADIIVKGFGDREVLYGEGQVLHSPIDVSRLLEVEHPSEDDVLHAKSLPSFGGSMSPEECEVVLSCLTTPYLRIPLLLDFFSLQDRHTYLFVGEMQRALRAVLFEPAAYVSPEKLRAADPRTVPMRLNASQRTAIDLANLRGDHSQRNCEEYLGTTYGLLLEELVHAPASILQPLLRILESITELGTCSVYSSNASYVLYVVGLVTDVLSYCRFAIHEQLTVANISLIQDYHQVFVSYLLDTVSPLLMEWLSESEANMDTPTQCVLHAYKGMLDRTVWKATAEMRPTVTAASSSVLTATKRKEESEGYLRRMLQSWAFVRARHGFGMGMQRTQLAAQEGDHVLTPEEKLLRFLQAQGLNTTNISQEALEQGRQLMMSGGKRRAVFVQIRSRFYNDTVRLPNLIRTDATSTTESKLLKLPPADVPENVLFFYLLADHTDITQYLDELPPQKRGNVFHRVVQSVLRDHSDDGGPSTASHDQRKRSSSRCSVTRSSSVSVQTSYTNVDSAVVPNAAAGAVDSTPAAVDEWSVVAPGVYRGPTSSGLLFHAQTCELFWRNNELKPVPDSMSHFSDFENILGKDILQCGLVSRHEHRHWVHIVGTTYDVVEWSAPPDAQNQGVHFPIVVSGELPDEPVMSAVFDGVTYDRPLVVEDEDPWPVPEERWAVDMVREVLRSAFPEGMKYHPLAAALPDAEGAVEDEDQMSADSQQRSVLEREGPASTTAPPAAAMEGVSEMRFITNDGPQYEKDGDRATWKEFVAYRYPQPHFHVFNLVPHARKMYRSLVYSSNQRFCLHSLALLSSVRTRDNLLMSAFRAGELKRRVHRESTIEIHRFNEAINGREVYLPARLLQGLMPSALLESFFIWHGEDNILRGYPLSEESESASVLTDADTTKQNKRRTEVMDYWFNYSLEISFADEGRGLVVVRRDDKSHTLIRPRATTTASCSQQGGSASPQDRARELLHRPTSMEALQLPEAQTLPADGALRSSPARRRGVEVDNEESTTSSSFFVGIGSEGTSDVEETGEVRHAMQQSTIALLHAALTPLSEGVCAEVLKRVGGDIGTAIQWATAPEHREEMGAIVERVDGTSQRPASAASRTTTAAPMKRVHPRPKDFVLINLHCCRALSPILQLLTGVEDASHMLAWGRPITMVDNEEANTMADTPARCVGATGQHLIISFVELPRLRTKFYTEVEGSSSRQRLFLADQPGWRLAEADDFSTGRQAHLQRLAEPFQQCLVLCNSAHEVALMVPNHDFTPMSIDGDPFSALLLFDRSSYTWRESVPSPYYLYVVHPSNGFLLPPTLSASLYYAVMQSATQHYSGAIRTIESCYTDSPFSPEEAFMFALFERTIGDAYPDAHAVRLKLAHAVRYSSNEYHWPLAAELTGYLMAKRHVSADCLLKEAEVVDLLKRCQKASPMVRSQLELFAGLLRLERQSPGRCGRTDVTLRTPALTRCGYPWERLLLYPWDKISPQKLKRVTYTTLQPTELVDEKLVDFLFKDELLQDEESGANCKHGFYFLYAMKMGVVHPTLRGRSVGVSLSQLLSRWVHLRHARWGREADQIGEAELAPSWCSTVLQLMELFPNAAWPAPVSPPASHQMSSGVNLNPSSAMPSAWDVAAEEGSQRLTVVADLFNAINQVASNLFRVSAETRQIREARALSQLVTPDTHLVTVKMYHHLVGRMQSQNTAMASITVSEANLGACYFDQAEGGRSKSLEALCVEPLRELGLVSDFMETHLPSATNEEEDDKEEACLPFDLRCHSLARAPLAQNMLDRLEEDARRFQKQQRNTVHHSFRCLSHDIIRRILTSEDRVEVSTALSAAVGVLEDCCAQLFSLAQRDREVVSALSTSILSLANQTGLPADTAAKETGVFPPPLMDHLLRLLRRERTPLPLESLCGGLLSTHFDEELCAANPFHGSVVQLRAELVLLMLRSNRGFFAEQSAIAVQSTLLLLEFVALARGASPDRRAKPSHAPLSVDGIQRRMTDLVRHFTLEIEPEVLAQLLAAVDVPGATTAAIALPAAVSQMLSGRLQQLTGAAVDVITSKRFYITISSCAPSAFAFELDPRFLLFEFMFNILLRARQVEMVKWFVSNIEAGQSRVQQMIMGQGKTTVVGPLLALMLADGQQLVTQVMPTALLKQTRSILRRCFSVVLVKHIYTLQFDRSCENGSTDGGGNSVELMCQKLKTAEEDRAVVIAAPECLKSLFLKGIEQMHMIASVTTESLNEERAVDDRDASHATTLRTTTIERSQMADAITPILEIWKRGVLIMDEVDVLLHPLRSELNFPIGLKQPIDMSGPRWLLPIHLLDAIFFFHRGRICEDAKRILKLGVSSFVEDDINASTAQKRAAADCRIEALRDVQDAIAQGFASRALQREPHLVLLDVGYYEVTLLPALIPWLQLWLHEQVLDCMSEAEQQGFGMSEFREFQRHTTPFLSAAVTRDEHVDAESTYLNAQLPSFSLKLLNLAHDWLYRLLPHVLAKIDRVNFGLLQPGDLSLTAGADTIPFSRKMMAVPFVAKDVPSRSSEFAHPDVVIGLTILAFRYEGLRTKDVKELLTQLKQDFARQAGPKEHRPAAKLYKQWLQLSAEDHEAHPTSPHDDRSSAFAHIPSHNVAFERAGVPLSQLQVTDRAQVLALHQLLHRVPEVVHYYLCSCIFPRTMNFQSLKISACGHELGSSMLFTKRIGFSGTPSNLLPLDLGECFYEPGSDGRVLSVLTNPTVVHAEVLPDDWNPLKVLDRIAAAQPPYAALIDAGALITNMNNEAVARYLLARLPASTFDGVVFLDRRDCQMILQRDNGLIVPVAQCGVALSRRFTFFDQVHTTGTDVKQSATALAVITLGKDLVFRDYAQGAYRMRGIGKGQRLSLYLIPEVMSRIRNALGSFTTGNLLRDVPAWLLVNSMRVEGLQFFKLSLQELANVWRKKAIANLVTDSIYANLHPDVFTGYLRCRRFHQPRPTSLAASADAVSQLPPLPLLQSSILEFRELIEYTVDARIEAPQPFMSHLEELIASHPGSLTDGDKASQDLVKRLLTRMRHSIQDTREAHAKAFSGEHPKATASDHLHRRMDLDAEIVHEQEAEEEQEAEAEQEEQRISAFSRDDEYHIPWAVSTLRTCGANPADAVRPTHGSCFYQVSSFQIRPSQPLLPVGPTFLLSDNYFRLEWHGVGERRLKNAFLFVEWVPVEALPSGSTTTPPHDRTADIYSGLVTLAEAESLRWLMHHSSPTNACISMSLRFVSTGEYMAMTDLFTTMMPAHRVRIPRQLQRPPTMEDALAVPEIAGAVGEAVSSAVRAQWSVSRDKAALLFRFFNNEMFFSADQIGALEEVLAAVSPADRLHFFMECLRVRRRHRYHWEDAPIAALFVSGTERGHLKQLAVSKRIQLALMEMVETLLRAAQPRPSAVLRREAQIIEDQLNVCTSSIVANCVHGGSGNTAQHPAQISAHQLALCMIEAFPKLLKAYSAYDIEQAITYAVTEHLRGNASGPSPSPPAPEGRQSLTILLKDFYTVYPMLELSYVHTRLSTERNETAKIISQRPAVLDEPWSCETCTFVNESRTTTCAMCLSDCPRGAPVSAAIGGSNEEADEEADADAPWQCPACTFINATRRQTVCSVCLGPNLQPFVQGTPMGCAADGLSWACPEGYWICSVEHGGCSKFNPDNVFYCQVCEKARKNLASVRF